MKRIRAGIANTRPIKTYKQGQKKTKRRLLANTGIIHVNNIMNLNIGMAVF